MELGEKNPGFRMGASSNLYVAYVVSWSKSGYSHDVAMICRVWEPRQEGSLALAVSTSSGLRVTTRGERSRSYGEVTCPTRPLGTKKGPAISRCSTRFSPS